MKKEHLKRKFTESFGHIKGLEVLGLIDLMGSTYFYVIHPLVFDCRQLPTSFHGYEVRSGFSDEQFPKCFYDKEKEEYHFSPDRFKEFVSNNLCAIQNKLETHSFEECLSLIHI